MTIEKMMLYMNIVKSLFLTLIFFILYFLSGTNFKYFNVLFNENGGAKESVPTEVYNLKIFMNKLNVNDFKLEGDLKNSDLLFQRSIEYTYPIRRHSQNSKNIFTLNTYTNKDCIKSAEYKGINYYVCK